MNLPNMLLKSIIILLLFTISTTLTEEDVDENVYDYDRLPKTVLPKSYRLEIITYLDDPTDLRFEGTVQILLEIKEPTDEIILHSLDLTIDELKITVENQVNTDESIALTKVATNPKHDYYIIHLNTLLQPGVEYLLAIPFAAPLNRDLVGYYKSSYYDKATKTTRWISTTQFEPAHARRAFPCFDEPDMKAKFLIILGHDANFQALSNMPVKTERPMEDREGWVWTEFDESVPMSTYLVAYTINDFTKLDSEISLHHNVQFRTWARQGAIHQCGYAATIGPKILKFFEEIYGIDFPLKKIDQIAFPDMGFGANENWGLISYRETALLYEPNVFAHGAKKQVAQIVAHELAHQWFGNLVTMKWWSDLWIKEGFSTYMASLAVEHIHPEWKLYEEESLDNTLNIFRLDALKTTHAVSRTITHTNQIHESFDQISYGKGSTVIRMMHLFLTSEVFYQGIRNYLKKYAYDNAEKDNLWEIFTELAHAENLIPSNVDIKEIMDSWTLQTGYPLITVNRDYQNGHVNVTQELYLTDSDVSRSKTANCWWVPLTYTTHCESNFTVGRARDWLRCNADKSKEEQTLSITLDSNEWILFNIKLAGLYKVNYDMDNWHLLINQLKSHDFERIHVLNRAQLIDDALSLAWSGEQDYDMALKLIEYLQHEKAYMPWKVALEKLNDINRIIRHTPSYGLFKKFMRHILTPVYEHLNGLNQTTEIDSKYDPYAVLHKGLVARFACKFHVSDCIQTAKAYFKHWQETRNPDVVNPIPSDLRYIVYCTALRNGNDEDWLFLWDRYTHSNVDAEKKIIIEALGCSREEWVLARLLRQSFNKTSEIRKQDAFLVFTSLVKGDVGFFLAKDYFMSNFKLIHDYYAPDTSQLFRLIAPLASHLSNKIQLAQLTYLIEANSNIFGKFEQIIRRTLETVKLNVQWKEHCNYKISNHLRSISYD